MMRFTRFIAVTAIAAVSATAAQAQGTMSATRPFSIGISGGASIPTSDLSDYFNTGYNVNGHIAIGVPTLPISLRGDVGYNSWDAANTNSENLHSWNFTANAVYTIPGAFAIHPYLIGGIGGYNLTDNQTTNTYSGQVTYSQSDNSTHFGYDLGGGISLPLAGFNAFIEAKYTHINNALYNGYNNVGATFVPITVGIMF